ERPERERPARLSGCDLRAQLRGERREGQADRREVRAVVERAPELLEDDRLLDEREARTALLHRNRDTGPAELRELRPGRLGIRGEEFARLIAKRLLLGCECEVHGSAGVGEAEHSLGDDVAEDLRGARLDGVAAAAELLVLPVAAVRRVLLAECAVRAEDLDGELRDALVRLGPHELRDRAFR